ncbi:MAG: hypothetical protein M3280_13130 [Actinomycetota bacterium]|nr:hypothetical protein [Actinomycetota bacterium]
MTTESFTAIALPHSVSSQADFHVSLFIAPRLTPDDDEGPLDSFTYFFHWTELLQHDATIELFDQAGPIDVRPLLGVLSTELWDALFPGDTPVRAPRDLDFTDRHWRTFAADEIHDAAKLMHVTSIFSDPTSPPLPSDLPLGKMMGSLGVEQTKRGEYDEAVITRGLDAAVGETGEPAEVSMSLRDIEAAITSEENPFARFAMQLHRARRFYERPESQLPYSEHPVEGATPASLARPSPDFHERCSLVGDHPSLQRRLGLVIDLAADDPQRLRESEWLSARVVVRGDEAVCRTSRTRCQVAGDDLITVPRTADWLGGRLRLGDSELFSLLDVDPDGTALKLDRYVWSIPRLMGVEENEDPVHAAPSALRSLGFTVTRKQKALKTQERLDHQRSLQIQVAAGDQPLLDTEDVTQGMRVEVWDEHAKAWFTLHARRIDAEVQELGSVVSGLDEDGFIQGTTATETPGVDKSPVHVHESVFGWEGWSLSAPRPGKRIRHDNGEEIVEEQDADPDPVTPLIVTSSVEPGSLPRLRYGRSYAFRAWAVDLAGNTRRHDLGPAPSAAPALEEALSSALTTIASPRVAPSLMPALRSETAASILRRRLTATEGPEEVRGPDLSQVLVDPSLERVVLARLRNRRTEMMSRSRVSPDITADRASLVAEAFREVAVDESRPFITDTLFRDAVILSRAGANDVAGVDEPTQLLQVVSPLRPFLRWNPVEPPAVVARHRFTAGESLRQLVIRSGVTQDPKTLEITVLPPDDYAKDFKNLGYRRTSQRHLAPPKTSQSEAELHSAFDDAIGSSDPLDHAKLLGIAVREAGTFFDKRVPKIDDPTDLEPQRGIALVADPTVPPSTLKNLPLAAGEAPAAGQYVIHDTDALLLPYLPDVAASGISLVFPEAGRDRIIAFPFGTEGFTASYPDDWPTRQPFRLVLRGSDVLSGVLDEHVLRIALPPGDIQRFRLSSSLDRADLDLFGLWRHLPPALRDNEDVANAAADGWLWALTPYDEVTLVHAVPRPLEAPRPTKLTALRAGEGSTDVYFMGAVDVHGPSTEMITAEARWVDPVDNLSLPVPHEQSTQAIAFTSPIREVEDLAVLYGEATDHQVDVPGVGQVWLHSAIQRLGDTRHHNFRLRFRAATRFREYFDPASLKPAPPNEPKPGDPVDDGQSVVGPEIEISVPSSARPAAPVVHSILPLFRWQVGGEPEQPVAVRRRRRAGVRIYLNRPWYSSGADELLGVLLAPRGNDATALKHPVSQWGADPIWDGAEVSNRAMHMELDNLLRATGLDDRPVDALPVVPPATLPLASVPGAPEVLVLGYRPQFNPDRGLWYVDAAVEPGDTFWPFVRLAVARYQPNSIPGCHLSAPVRCDYVQLVPERTASVSRTDSRHVRVVVSGPVATRDRPTRIVESPASRSGIQEWAAFVGVHRKVIARLQRVDPSIPTDLGWETISAVELSLRGHGRTTHEAAWVGELAAPEDLPLRTPGKNEDWRVTIEEWERLPGDPLALVDPASPPVWEQRLIYADEITL